MATGPITLETTIVAATPGEADDLDVETIIAPFVGGAYDLDTLRQFATEVKRVARLTLIRASIVVAQIRKETGNFRYGGQVKPGQFNFAGIGSTNGGAAGLSFRDAAEGVRAVFAHQCNYLFGAFADWPERCRFLQPLAVRNAAVLGNIAEFGKVVVVLGDYVNGRWAWSPDKKRGSLDNGYATGIAAIANAMLGQEGAEKVGNGYNIAFSAGHHNTDGGNRDEYITTGELTEELSIAAEYQGFGVYVPQPDGPDADTVRGDGDFPGGLQAVGRAVVAQHARTPFVLFLEAHTQGGPRQRGVFGIWPDMRGDVDDDARANLIPRIVNRFSAATGIPVWTSGLLPESRTYVGAGGSRLGVFYATEPIKADVTRCLIEFGAHDTVDLQIHRSPGFYRKAARATVEAICEWLKLPIKPWDSAVPGVGKVPLDGGAPNRNPDNPHALTIEVPGRGLFTMVDPILTYWEDCGGVFGNPNALGYPVTGMYDDGGVLVQYFERGRVEVHGTQISSALVGLELARATGKAA